MEKKREQQQSTKHLFFLFKVLAQPDPGRGLAQK